MRRRRGREFDFDRLLPPDEPGPLDHASERELSSALAGALDDLPEPYRQVVILSVRHGLKPADIAHVLDRSPGAVRVQLHRGLRLLRRAMPAGFAATILAAIAPSRGLAAVRSALVAHAKSQWSGGAFSALLAGVLSARLAMLASALLVVAGRRRGVRPLVVAVGSECERDRIVAQGGHRPHGGAGPDACDG
jgi:hypothetical protein